METMQFAENEVRLLENSMDALGLRTHLADHARQSLDIQTYIFHDGLTTRLLIQSLLEAADRGVRIRMLLDDMTSYGQEARISALACHANIEVRLFNPLRSGRGFNLTRILFFLNDVRQLHRRMHNKLWLADSQLAITGGRNLGDEYYDASSETNFSDIDLLIRGPVVAQMQTSFDSYWNSSLAVPIAKFRPFAPNDEEHKRWRLRVRDRIKSAMREREGYVTSLQRWQRTGRGQHLLNEMISVDAGLLVDSPEKMAQVLPWPIEQQAFSPLIERVRAVRRELILVGAYFVPGELGMGLFKELIDRGVRVRVLTNSLAATDLPLVHGGYTLYRKALLEMGVELYEMRDRQNRSYRWRWPWQGKVSLHSKAMIFDDQSAFVGSFNLDPRSVFWNTEIGVLMNGRTVAGQLKQLVELAMSANISYRLGLDKKQQLRWFYQTKKGLEVLHRERASWWRRCLVWLSVKFAPEDWL